MHYTSELAANALALKPVGQPHEETDCVCAMCRRPIEKGQPSTATKELPRSFTDWVHIGSSGYICGWCKATTPQAVMRHLQRSVITRNGIYNLNTDAARSWFWLTPPDPPFSVVINHSVQATFHYFWRTPVTLDSRIVNLNLEGTVYQIKRQRVLQAIDAGKLLLDRASELQLKKDALKSAFVVMQRDPTEPSARNGHIHSDARKLATMYSDCNDAVRFLETLNPGEISAASSLLKQKPSVPEQPLLTSKF